MITICNSIPGTASRLFVLMLMLSFSTAALANSEATIVTLKMSDFFRLDNQTAWALVSDRNQKTVLFLTTDGGTTWEPFPTSFSVQHIFFQDLNNGWGTAIEQKGDSFRFFCLHTVDSGRTWSKQGYIGSSDTVSGIAFDTVDHGWIVGEGSSGMAIVYETTDGGDHWSKLPWETKPASGLYGVSVHDGIAYAWSGGAGGSGIFHLHPGVRPEQISDMDTMNFAFVSGGSIVSAGNLDVYLKSYSDTEWVPVLRANDRTFWDMKFVDSDHGCVAGGELYCTYDGGRTWKPRHMPRAANGGSEFIYRLYLVDILHGWAEGDNTIYETNDGARSWTKVDFFGIDQKPLTHTRPAE